MNWRNGLSEGPSDWLNSYSWRSRLGNTIHYESMIHLNERTGAKLFAQSISTELDAEWLALPKGESDLFEAIPTASAITLEYSWMVNARKKKTEKGFRVGVNEFRVSGLQLVAMHGARIPELGRISEIPLFTRMTYFTNGLFEQALGNEVYNILRAACGLPLLTKENDYMMVGRGSLHDSGLISYPCKINAVSANHKVRLKETHKLLIDVVNPTLPPEPE